MSIKFDTEIREYSEGLNVAIRINEDNNQWVVTGWTLGGILNCINIDIVDLLNWIKINKPELMDQVLTDNDKFSNINK